MRRTLDEVSLSRIKVKTPWFRWIKCTFCTDSVIKEKVFYAYKVFALARYAQAVYGCTKCCPDTETYLAKFRSLK